MRRARQPMASTLAAACRLSTDRHRAEPPGGHRVAALWPTPMNSAVCADLGLNAWLRESEMSSVSEMLLVAAIVGLLLATMLAPLFQRIYSRRMQRLMQLTEVAQPPSSWWEQRAQGQSARGLAHADSALPLARAMQQRDRRIRIATWISYLVFVAAGSALFWLVRERADTASYVVIGFLASMSLGSALVNVRPDGGKRLLLAAPLLVIVLSVVEDPNLGIADLLAAAGLMVCLYLTGVHRTMRAIVVPLAIVFAGLMFSVVLLGGVSYAATNCFGIVAEKFTMSSSAIWFAAGVVIVLLGYWLPLLILEGLLGLTQRGWLSDISL